MLPLKPFFIRLISFVSIVILCNDVNGQSAFEINYIDKLQDEYIIDKDLYILEDSKCQLDFEKVISNTLVAEFIAFNQSSELESRSCYWLHFRIKSAPDFKHYFKDWKLVIGEADYASVYIVDKTGKILEYKSFGKWFAKSKKKEVLNFKSQRISLSFDPSEELSFYIKYQKEDNHKHIVDIRFKKYDLYQSSSFLFSTWQDWLFLGFILTMILLNFLFYYSTRYIAYLFHGLFIFGLFIFILDLYGVTINLPIIKEYPFLVQLVDILGIGIADIAYFQFVRHYLNLKEKLPLWDQILSKIVIAKYIFYPLLILFYYSMYNEPLTDKFLLVFLLIEYSIIIYFLIFRLKPKEKAALYLIIGSLFLLVLLLIDTLSLFSSIGISKTLSQIGILGEILAFSFGLSYRVRQLQKEEEQAEKIRELSEFKSQLLTNITHEFRTPLTIIQGVSELFQESLVNKTKPEELKKGYDAIERNSRNLLNLVNQMLDLAKLENKSLNLDVANVDLVAVVKDVINGLSNGIQKKNITLTFESMITSLNMDLDEQKVHTILVNLISNAVKFTPQFGKISIRLNIDKKADESLVVLNIEDNGKGIPKDDLPLIFDRFFQQKSNSPTSEGTGIGLSLVKELVDLMSGSIEVESEINKGTNFTLQLPIKREQLYTVVEHKQPESKSTIVQEDNFDMLDSKPVLLIVEDNYDIVEYLERLLSNDYKLIKAFDGLEGLEKANSIIPDLIISDLMMPKMDGIKLCQSLKSNEKTNHIPIIILTAKSAFDHKMEGLSTGADAYLTKPFKKEELFLRLKKLNESRQILQQKYSQFSLIEKPKELKKENSFLHKVHSIIEENLNNPQFNVEEMANQMFMSRMQLHRKIKAVSERTSSNYIRSYRLYKSKPQLADIEKTISEIAWDVGFQDVNYYSKSFQKEFGMSPSDYREKIK